jgi:dTDP-4-amino-4,6-dideoxygalactose transaminase
VIPLVDLKAQIAPLRAELDAALRQVVDETAFILGPAVERFERAFAEYVGVKHCIGVQSGTAALQLALLARGIGPGDEVITSPASFFATAEAISLTGATPAFVDVEPDTLNLDADKLEAAIGPRTRAIVPVHLFGQAADLERIFAIARKHNLPVLEDACQAHGASYAGKRLGSLGFAGAFSFYPGKNLGAFGEAGAVTTSDDELASRIRRLRDHGSPEKYKHTVVGFNYRMEGIQGAVLGVKLAHLDRWNAQRRALAKRYGEKLSGLKGLTLPVERSYGIPSWHLYAARSPARDAIFRRFEKDGIARAIHYPVPIHLQEAYAGLELARGSFPVAERAADELLSLPLYPELTEAQQDRVIEAVRAALAEQ